MFSKTGWVGIRLVASPDFAVIRFVTSVNMTVLFSVTRIGKPSVTSFKFATKRFFS